MLNILKQKQQDIIKQYKVVGIVGNRDKVNITLKEQGVNYDLIHMDDYKTIWRNKKLGEKIEMTEDKNKVYRVVDLPNNTKRIEDLLNEYHKKGFAVRFINDYSVVFFGSENNE